MAVAHCHNSITSSARQENYARWAEPSQRNMSTFARNPKIRAGAVEPNNIIALTGAALRKTHHDTLNHGPVHPVKTQPPEAWGSCISRHISYISSTRARLFDGRMMWTQPAMEYLPCSPKFWCCPALENRSTYIQYLVSLNPKPHTAPAFSDFMRTSSISSEQCSNGVWGLGFRDEGFRF